MQIVQKSLAARDIPSTSSPLLNIAATEELLELLDVGSVPLWVSEKMENNETKFMFWDGVHSIPKYTLDVNASLELTVFIITGRFQRITVFILTEGDQSEVRR